MCGPSLWIYVLGPVSKSHSNRITEETTDVCNSTSASKCSKGMVCLSASEGGVICQKLEHIRVKAVPVKFFMSIIDPSDGSVIQHVEHKKKIILKITASGKRRIINKLDQKCRIGGPSCENIKISTHLLRGSIFPDLRLVDLVCS
ncbi:unnamed protein product [Gordionus sp. m RMFG-2023]